MPTITDTMAMRAPCGKTTPAMVAVMALALPEDTIMPR
jgi:hypothetical protein